MKKELTSYLRALTAADRKTLSQKGLKAMEEVGELAKKILPFDNAHSTTHRFVERASILEECADTILCSLSIAYELGFSDDEIYEMMFQKAKKWGALQERETHMVGPLPYELHITVKEVPDATLFQETCKSLGVKPIFLALQDASGKTVLPDVMTSSVCFGDNRKAAEELDRVTDGLVQAGFEVVRRKVETVPWHPAAPSLVNGRSEMPTSSYFESHVGVLIEGDTAEVRAARKESLRAVVQVHGAHLSRNVFKAISANVYSIMVTLRSATQPREAFEVSRDALVGHLKKQNFLTDKVITEFSLFDSRISRDESWTAAG